jgi:hypothetical protein
MPRADLAIVEGAIVGLGGGNARQGPFVLRNGLPT